MMSVLLLDSVMILFVMVLLMVFLGVRYVRMYVGGVVIVFAGLAALVFGDASAEATGGGMNRVFGDFLVICVVVMYVMLNVLVEVFLWDVDKVEILVYVGVMGFAISGA